MTIFKTLVAAAVLFAGGPTLAATLLTVPGPTAETATPGSISYSFTAGAGAGTTSFDINGYRTIDGINCCTDTFTLNLNGTDVLSGSFDLGGASGGTSTLFFAPAGATFSATSPGFALGGTASIFTPLALVSGTNTITFIYSGTSQGLDDEAWGLSNVVVTGDVVPEPEAWMLMVVGFGIVGIGIRRRAGNAVAA